MQFHPDRNPGNKDAEDRFIDGLRSVRSSERPGKKRDLWRYGIEGLKGTGFTGFRDLRISFSTFGDIFEDFFGFGTTQRRRTKARSGADLRYDLKISFYEAAFGKEHEIEIPRNALCDVCDGTGAKLGTHPTHCPNCKGTGQVTRSQGFLRISTTCGHCRGEGNIIPHPCKACHGHGRVRQTKKLQIKILLALIPVQNWEFAVKVKREKEGGLLETSLYLFM